MWSLLLPSSPILGYMWKKKITHLYLLSKAPEILWNKEQINVKATCKQGVLGNCVPHVGQDHGHFVYEQAWSPT